MDIVIIDKSSTDDGMQYVPVVDESKDAEIIVLVDTSDSMQRNAKAILQFMKDAQPELKKATKRFRIRMMPFSSPDKPAELSGVAMRRVDKPPELAYYSEAALQAEFKRGGKSGGLPNALKVLTDTVKFRDRTRRIVLVFGDSGSLGSDAEAQAAAKAFHEKFNCTIYMVCKPRDGSKSRGAMDKVAKVTGGGIYPPFESMQKSDDLSVQPDWSTWLKPPK